MTLRLNVWSGPRNVSTALMYAFRERADTSVVDEPLYAHYLDHTGLDHPGRDEILASQSSDARRVLEGVLLADVATDVLVAKQMAHHRRGLPTQVRDRLDQACSHVLLTRDPRRVLRSYARQVERPRLQDLGYVEQVELLDRLGDDGRTAPVIDSTALLADPRGVLSRVCAAVGIPFDPAMLSWPAGPTPEDGVWARHWYAGVHHSTGFRPPSPPPAEPLPDHLATVAAAALPLYERLLEASV